jgi:hypothetical protein
MMPVFSWQGLDAKDTFFLNCVVKKMLNYFFLRQDAIVEYAILVLPRVPCSLKKFQNEESVPPMSIVVGCKGSILSLLVICPLRNMEPLKEASPQPRVS